MPNLGGAEILIILIVLAITIASVALMIWALVDCIQNEPSEGNDKLIWILVIVLTGWLGALIYLLVRRPKRIAEQNHNAH